MTESGAATPAGAQKLDDVMLAMDVVDTLRHREQLVMQELDAGAREAALITRLKEIYAAQGIDVPERVLKEGVKALEENRFVYSPPAPSLGVTLAKIYIARDRWLLPVTASLAAIGMLVGAWYVGVARPAEDQARRQQVELTQTRPASIDRLLAQIRAIATEDRAILLAATLESEARAALAAGSLGKARAAEAALQQLFADLEAVFEIRVVYGPDEPYSGVFRIPDDVPQARNYYLIVEAVDARGRPVAIEVTSEEDRRTDRVTRWGQRVSQEVFDAVAADKGDDQIIQNAVIGTKPRGRLTPVFTVETPGGAILDW